MAKSLLRANVGGLIFWGKKGHKLPIYEGVEGWLLAGKPENCLVFDSPVQLIGAGFPIVDARKVDNCWFHVRKKIPLQSKIRVPLIEHKLLELSELPALHFPGLVFFDANSRFHKPKAIGTSAPSKISKGTK